MKIMFSHYDESVRSVAVYLEGNPSPLYLGPIEEPETVSEIAKGGEEAIAHSFLEQRKWIETLSELAGVDVTAAEKAINSYRNAGT
jgi:hypothetical protein